MNLILSLSNPDILPETLRTRQVEFGPSGGLIGRADDCDWVLDDPERFVSSRHVKITFKKEVFSVEDISTNGTYLNDQLIGKGNRMAIITGDVLRVGRFIMTVQHIADDGSVIGQDKPEDPFKLLPQKGERIDTDDLLAADGSASNIDNFLGNASADASNDLLDHNATLPTSSHMPGIKDALPTLMAKDGEGWREGANDPKPDANPEDVLLNEAPAELDAISNTDPLADIPMAKDMGAEQKIQLEPETIAEPEPVAIVEVEPEVIKPKPRRTKKTTTKKKPLSDGSFSDEFLNAVSLSVDDADGASGEILGSVLRELLTGTLDLLDARIRMRNELRLQGTMIGARENNPLKFSINYQDAIGRLLKGESTGFKDPIESTEEVMADLREHQLAMFAGIDAGVKALLGELDPKRISANKGLLAMPTMMTKLNERHAAITEDTVERSGGVFWRAFSDAYQNAIAGARANRANG